MIDTLLWIARSARPSEIGSSDGLEASQDLYCEYHATKMPGKKKYFGGGLEDQEHEYEILVCLFRYWMSRCRRRCQAVAKCT